MSQLCFMALICRVVVNQCNQLQMMAGRMDRTNKLINDDID